MEKCSDFQTANARAKRLIPTRDNVGVTVAPEPLVYQGKMFWPVVYIDSQTGIKVGYRGSIAFIADNGKLISVSSNPLVAAHEDWERLLLEEYER